MHQHSIQIRIPCQTFLGHYRNIIIRKTINLI